MPIDFAKALNPAQLEAATAPDGPTLVIAGAGSGKTRTIVYRLACLMERGVAPETILLLTFTRKASNEMLRRANLLLGQHAHGDQGAMSVHGVIGGTFHSYSYSVLRRNAPLLGYRNGFTVMDRADAEDVLGQVKSKLGLSKTDRSFPKKGTVLELISKARNKEQSLDALLTGDSYHLLPYADDLSRLADGYEEFKVGHGLMDYDDLLFNLERLLVENDLLSMYMRERVRHVLVDEYQDTNRVQARLVKLLAGENGNVMAVGDDAQSIYAFRGADVRNILSFPEVFPGARVVRLEQNYRSTQPILDLANQILEGAKQRFDKHLFTERQDGPTPELVRPLSDLTQARLAVEKILELNKQYPLHEIAVLMRAGYQSYALEVVLNKLSLAFQKFGGLKFAEAAHVKDAVSFLRLVQNPADLPAWTRALAHIKGVGPKTSARIFEAVLGRDKDPAKYLASVQAKYPDLKTFLAFLDDLRRQPLSPAEILERVLEFYRPIVMERFPDDWPRRQAGLEQLGQIASSYSSLDAFLADLSLESPGEDGKNETREDHLVLSTVHSSKGLEWSAVLVLDLVEERFPSRHALQRDDDLEEERRLFYVACTRARDSLVLFAPDSLYNRYRNISEPAVPSPFLRGVRPGTLTEWRESYSGGLSRSQASDPSCPPCPTAQAATSFSARPDGQTRRETASPALRAALAGTPCPRGPHEPPFDAGSAEGPQAAEPPRLVGSAGQGVKNGQFGYCRHKIFGRGKIIAALPPDKYRVNFPGFGPKVILAEYLTLE